MESRTIQGGKTDLPRIIYEEGFGTNNKDHFEKEWSCGCKLSSTLHPQSKEVFVSCGQHDTHPTMNRVVEHIVPQKIQVSGNTFQPYAREGDCLIFDSQFVHNKLRRRIEEALRKRAGTGQLINIALYLGIKLD